MQNENDLHEWLDFQEDPPTITVQNVDLGQHSASFDESGRLAITGASGSILISSQEAWKLLDALYSQRDALYHSVSK